MNTFFFFFFLLSPLFSSAEEDTQLINWNNFQTPTNIETERKEAKENPFYKRAKEYAEVEKKAIILIDQFFEKDISNNDYKKFKNNLEHLAKELDDLYKVSGKLQPSEKISKKIKEKSELIVSKYKDQALKLDGMLIKGSYPGLYYVFFEKTILLETSNFWKIKENIVRLKIRFKVKLNDKSPFSLENLTNVYLVLLNKDGFEMFRHFIGNIKEGAVVTGNFEILEKDYEAMSCVRFFTDQDKGHEFNIE